MYVTKYVVYAYRQGIVVVLPSIELYLGCADADRNVDALMLVVCGIVAMTKMIWFRIYANNLITTYKFAVNDYLMIENAHQRAIMLRHAFIAKTILCSTIGIAYFDSFMLWIVPVFGGSSKIGNEINGTQEVLLDYTLPSRCALEVLHVPKGMHMTQCLVGLFLVILVCTSNYGSTYFLRVMFPSYSIILRTKCRILHVICENVVHFKTFTLCLHFAKVTTLCSSISRCIFAVR